MSYCRWSTDAFRCDLYCYESDSGYETHVAVKRPVYETAPPEFPNLKGVPKDQIGKVVLAYWMAVDEAHDKAGSVTIGGKYDGKSFTDDTPEEFLETLTTLRAAGYNVPDYVLENAQEEIDEEKSLVKTPDVVA